MKKAVCEEIESAINEKSWPRMPLSEVVENLDSDRIPLNQDERSSRQGSFPYYGASGVIDHVDDFLYDEKLLLVAEDGANLLSRATPIAFTATGKYWVNNHAHVLRPRPFIEHDFLKYVFNATDLRPYVSGSAQPKLSQRNLNRIPIPVPPVQIQRRIAAKLDDLTSHARHVNDYLTAIPPLIDQFRQSVLARAFTGELTADWRKKHPDVEPASDLLERIKVERREKWIENYARMRTVREGVTRRRGRRSPMRTGMLISTRRSKSG
jgi:type I restriction enzyme S subunit